MTITEDTRGSVDAGQPGRRRPRRSFAVPAQLVLLVVVLALPWLDVDGGFIRYVMLVLLIAMLTSGFNLGFGYTGELALSQPFMYALGAYVTGFLAKQGADMVVSLVAVVVVVAIAAAIIAVPSVRLSGWGLAIASLFLVIVLPDVINLLAPFTGGYIGLVGIPEPVLFGQELDQTGFYVVLVVAVAVWFACMRNLVVSRHGNALRTLRESPVLAQSLGIDVRRLKTKVFVVGSLPAGVAGCLYAYLDRFISPETFTVDLVFAVIAASIIGGSETVFGAIVGAAIIQYASGSESFADYRLVVYGALLVVGAVFAITVRPRLVELVRSRSPRARRTASAEPAAVAGGTAPRLAPIAGGRLQVTGVSKQFGGVRALDEVSLVAEPGRVTALIGANGSGKTTLLNAISGFHRVDGGTITLDTDELAVLGSPHRIARKGVARTFQTPLMPQSVTTGQAISAARYSLARNGFLSSMVRWPSHRRTERGDLTAAHQELGLLNLGTVTDVRASTLSLGTRRLVEVGRALARQPRLILLDEPASGLERGEVADLATVIGELRRSGATVVIVEHNFEMVCDIADMIYVLDNGRVLAAGPPAEIVENDDVVRNYLGELRTSAVTADEPSLHLAAVAEEEGEAGAGTSRD